MVLWFGSILFILSVIYCFLEILENSGKMGFYFCFLMKNGIFVIFLLVVDRSYLACRLFL